MTTAVDSGYQLPVVYRDTNGQAAFVVLRHDGDGQPCIVGFHLVATTAHAGAWHAAEFAVRQVAPATNSGMTGKTIRSLPIGELLAAARQAATTRRDDQTTRGRKRLVTPSELYLSAFLHDARGKAPRDDSAYAGLALEYSFLVEKGDRSPAKTLAERFGGAPGTWANRVAEARRRGLLTPVKAGEAGGGLTDKAIDILSGGNPQWEDEH